MTRRATLAAVPATACARASSQRLRDALGDGLVDSLVKPGDDMWVRVRTDAWRAGRHRAARRDRLRLLLLPVGDRLDAQPVRPRRGRSDRATARARRHDHARATPVASTRMQVFARVTNSTSTSASRSRPTCPTTTPSSTAGSRCTPAPTGTSVRRTRCSASTSPGHPDLRNMYLPTEFEGHPVAQGLPAAGAHREAVAGHRRRRAACPATTPTTTQQRGRSDDRRSADAE